MCLCQSIMPRPNNIQNIHTNFSGWERNKQRQIILIRYQLRNLSFYHSNIIRPHSHMISNITGNACTSTVHTMVYTQLFVKGQTKSEWLHLPFKCLLLFVAYFFFFGVTWTGASNSDFTPWRPFPQRKWKVSFRQRAITSICLCCFDVIRNKSWILCKWLNISGEQMILF